MIERLSSIITRWQGAPLFIPPLLAFLLSAPLGESLWVDEAISAWVISGDPFIRAIETQGQSPLYFIILKGSTSVLGEGELALRSLSILCFLGTLALFWRLAFNLIGPIGCGAASLVFISKDASAVAAISARPYELALFFSLATVAAFLRWTASGKRSFCLLYQFCWALTFYAHYLFAGIGLVLPFAAFASKRVVPWKKIFLSSVIPFTIFAFGIPHLAILYDKKEALSFASKPDLFNFIFAVIDPSLLTGVVASLTLAFVFQGKIITSQVLNRLSFFGAIWWLMPLGVFYLLFNGELFVPRYFLWNTGGLALLVGVLFSAIGSEKAKVIASTSLSLFILVHAAQREFIVEDWRGAALAASELSRKIDPNAPIFVYSGLIEANSLLMERSKEEDEYLTAPAHYYLKRSETSVVLPLPLLLEDGRYFQRFISPSLEKFGSIIAVIAHKTFQRNEKSDSFAHFESAFSEKGISMTTEKALSLVKVVLITKKKEEEPTDKK